MKTNENSSRDNNTRTNNHLDNNKYKKCIGCNIIENCVIIPTFKLGNHFYDCPCYKCLIKCICNHVCKPFKTYITHYSNLINKDLSEYSTYLDKIQYLEEVKKGPNFKVPISDFDPMNRFQLSFIRGTPIIVKHQNRSDLHYKDYEYQDVDLDT